MYALKTINGNIEKSVALGSSYSIQFEELGEHSNGNSLAIITGDNEALGYEISHDTDAFITTLTVLPSRVVNRNTKLKHAFDR